MVSSGKYFIEFPALNGTNALLCYNLFRPFINTGRGMPEQLVVHGYAYVLEAPTTVHILKTGLRASFN